MKKEVSQYISDAAQNSIVEWKKCRVSGQDFPLMQSDIDFFQAVSPVFAGKKYLIPTPSLCPDLRHMRRMCFRNDRSLYHAKCSATGKNILSMFAPEKGYTVYERNYWW